MKVFRWDPFQILVLYIVIGSWSYKATAHSKRNFIKIRLKLCNLHNKVIVLKLIFDLFRVCWGWSRPKFVPKFVMSKGIHLWLNPNCHRLKFHFQSIIQTIRITTSCRLPKQHTFLETQYQFALKFLSKMTFPFARLVRWRQKTKKDSLWPTVAPTKPVY